MQMNTNFNSPSKSYSPPECEDLELIPYTTVCESGTLGNVSEGGAGDDWTD